MEKSPNKRSRILDVQKTTLVQLVENFFIHHFGTYHNVNVNVIDYGTWKKIEGVLNKLGPQKTATQWKNSFQSMCTRVRKKATLIRQTDANLSDNLTRLDLRIYQMLPTISLETLNEALFQDRESSLEDVYMPNSSQASLRAGFLNYQDFQENSQSIDTANGEQNIQIADDTEMPREFLEELGTDYQCHESIANRAERFRTVVIENEQDLGSYMDDDAIIVEDSEESTNCFDEVELNRTVAIKNEELEVDMNYIPNEDAEISIYDAFQRNEETTTSSFPAQSSSSVKPVNGAKTSARIPEIQKERLVQLIQNNFLKAVGRFAGPNGAAIKAQLWKKVAKELNILGPSRTAEQWKSTFDGIKASAKTKLADGHNDGTVGKPLNRLEEKIVSIYGLDSLDGDQRLGETGFNYKETIPSARRISNPRCSPIGNLKRPNSTNRRENSQVSSTATSGAFECLNRPDKIVTQNREENLNVGLEMENALNHQSGSPPPGSSEDDMILRQILQEIRDEEDGVQTATVDFQQVADRNVPPTCSNMNSTATSKSRMTNAGRGGRFQEGVNPRTTIERSSVEHTFARPAQINRGSSTRPNISTLTRIRDGDDMRSRPRGRNVYDQPPRLRHSTVARHDDDDDDEDNTLFRQNRDRSNLRNRYTSYDMVQRSIQQQELFIEQNGRNHAELMYATDRNHAEMIGIFTSTLKTIADVCRDYFNKQ